MILVIPAGIIVGFMMPLMFTLSISAFRSIKTASSLHCLRQSSSLANPKVTLPKLPQYITDIRHDIKWSGSQPITSATENRLAKVLVKEGEYVDGIYLRADRIEQITKTCKSEGISVAQAMSLRKQLLASKTLFCAGPIDAKGSFIQAKYDKGDDIEKICTNLDFPAVAVLRMIIKRKIKNYYPDLQDYEMKALIKYVVRWNESTALSGLEVQGDASASENSVVLPGAKQLTPAAAMAIKTFTDPNFRKFVLTARDFEQLQIAKQIDQASFVEPCEAERIASMARAWEQTLYAHLDALGIAYYTEEECKQIFSSTPDVVFKDIVYINGTRVYWMDCKCFYGSTKSHLFQKKLLEQSNRYNVAFQGNGAMVYEQGYSVSLQQVMKDKILVLGAGPRFVPV